MFPITCKLDLGLVGDEIVALKMAGNWGKNRGGAVHFFVLWFKRVKLILKLRF